jgi:hypothetical protein
MVKALKTFSTIRQKQTHNNWTLTARHKVKHFNMSPDSIICHATTPVDKPQQA